MSDPTTAWLVAVLESGGIELLNGPMDRPWGPRTASFQDPDGHTWEIASQPPTR